MRAERAPDQKVEVSERVPRFFFVCFPSHRQVPSHFRFCKTGQRVGETPREPRYARSVRNLFLLSLSSPNHKKFAAEFMRQGALSSNKQEHDERLRRTDAGGKQHVTGVERTPDQRMRGLGK
jgi:hypothetical protein